MTNKFLWAFKLGLFIAVLTWFSFTMYQFGKTVLNGVSVPFTDVPGSIGFGFRVAASFIAVVTVLFYLVKRDFSQVEVLNSFRWIVLLEAAYWILFLPAGVWGMQYNSPNYDNTFFIIESGLPCIVQALVMPTVLVVFFFKLGANKPAQGAIRWGLIAAATYIFVLWFNYTAQWWSEIYLRGTGFLLQYRLYTFEFALTVIGLLLIGAYTLLYAVNSSKAANLWELNLKKAGAIVTALGLYFFTVWLLTLVFGDTSRGELTVWPTYISAHSVDLWMATLPLVGVVLLLLRKSKT